MFRQPMVVGALMLAVAAGMVAGFAGEPAASPLAERLKPFAPYLGKTWTGELVSSRAGKPLIDVSRWERALNGQAIRILHSVNDGDYGGESIVMWDAKRQAIVAWYFTTAGFRTEGTMTFEDGAWVSIEEVTGEGSGITKVKSVSRLLPDGRMHNKATFLKNGQWVEGHEITYKETPEAKVVFR